MGNKFVIPPLEALTDVVVVSPSDGDILVYQASTRTWVNAPAPSPGPPSGGRTITGASGTMTNSDNIVDVNHAGPVAIAGASGRTAYRSYVIKDTSGAAYTNNITYTPASGTIDGMASILIQQNYDSLTIYSDGTNEFTQ